MMFRSRCFSLNPSPSLSKNQQKHNTLKIYTEHLYQHENSLEAITLFLGQAS